jgi:hypothetical protein
VAGDFTDNGTFNGSSSSVEFNGSTDIAGTGSTTFNHLLVSGAATTSSDFSVLGHFTNNGAFDGTGSTVTFSGSTDSTIGGVVSPTVFDSLHAAKNGARVNVTVNLAGLNDLTVTSGTLDLTNSTVSQNAAGGVLTASGGATLRIAGTNSLPTFGTSNLDPASTVEYYGTGSQIIGAANYGNLTSTSTGARILPSGTTNGIAGVFTPGSNAYTVTGSTVDFNGSGAQTIPAFNYYNLRSSSTGYRTLATNGTVGVAGAFIPGNNNYALTNSTINFNGGAQTIPAFTYYNLFASGSGSKTLAGNIAVNGSLNLAGPLADAGFTVTVNGNVANSAAHTGTGRVILAQGAAAHRLSGGGTYGNLELNDPNGALLDLTNLTVNGTLTFSRGLITTTTNIVVIGPTGAVARASGYVAGNLRKTVTIGSARTNSFEIGDAATYAPITCVFSNVTTAGSVTASTAPGDHPDLARSGILSYAGVNRFWTLTNSSLAFSNYSAQFSFVPGDLDPQAVPANFRVAQRTAGNWSTSVPVSVTSTSVLSGPLAAMGDFALGAMNTAPLLTVPGTQILRAGDSLVVTNTATDAETNALSFSLVSPPSGMSIDPNSGVVTWRAPVLAQATTNVVQVTVTDNGQPTLSATGSFTVVVLAAPQISDITSTNGTIVIKVTGAPGDSYLIQATPALNPPISWTVIGTNVIPAEGYSYFMDSDITNYPMRFYRFMKQ